MIRFLRRTPVQTFVLVPLATIAAEAALHAGRPAFAPVFLPIMLWGFMQYRLAGRYRLKHGGGGPGLAIPPERLVDTGIYAWTRNPMYLGHVIYMVGVVLTFQSAFGAALTLLRSAWFHARVLGDERSLALRLGQPYLDYKQRVKRWIPGLV